MNKKYDYAKIAAELPPKLQKSFCELTRDEESTALQIYNVILNTVKDSSGIFSIQKNLFINWLTTPAKGNDMSRLECYILNTYNKSPKFFLSDNCETRIESLIYAWSNKASSLKVNQLKAIWVHFIRYLQSKNGIESLYEKSIYDAEVNIPHSDAPFYESSSYKNNMLKKLKDKVCKSICKDVNDGKIMSLLWDEIFEKGRNFKYSNVERRFREFVSTDIISSSKLSRKVRVLNKLMLKELLNNDLDEYFDMSAACYVGDKLYNIRTALEEVALVADDSYTNESLLKDKIKSFANSHNVKVNWNPSYSKCLAQLNIDADYVKHKGYKVNIYKNGVYHDFKTGRSGRVLGGLIPYD